jgi:hypothetical protein
MNALNENLYKIMEVHSEQPTTCPKCGARTEILFDLGHSINVTQIHECLNTLCGNIFVAVSDDIDV